MAGINVNDLKGVDFNAIMDANKDESSHRFFDIDRKKLKSDGRISYIIRFLPYRADKSPVLASFQHAFRNGNGEMLYMPCTEAIGVPCPICNEAKKYYALKNEQMDKIGSTLWRKKLYFANVMVIADFVTPENNGMIRPFKFGPQIYKCIELGTTPPMPNMPKAKPFDIFGGNNFNLVVIIEDKQPKYTYSTFDPTVTAIYEPEKVLAQVTDLEAEFSGEESNRLPENAFEVINNHLMYYALPFNNNTSAPAPKPAAPAQPVYAQPAQPPVQPQQPVYAQPVQPPQQPVYAQAPVQQPTFTAPVPQPTMPAFTQPHNNQQSPANTPTPAQVQHLLNNKMGSPLAMPVNSTEMNQRLQSASAAAKAIDGADIDDLIS